MARLCQATADHDMAARVQIGELEAEQILPIGDIRILLDQEGYYGTDRDIVRRGSKQLVLRESTNLLLQCEGFERRYRILLTLNELFRYGNEVFPT